MPDEKNNTGDCNTGDCNTGDCNTGDRNTGDWNTGDRNTGYWNTGYWNTGYWNTGYCNTGDRNTGDRNTGYCNTGDRNTGYCNTGDRNTGDRNTGDCNTGHFCTETTAPTLFDKPVVGMTHDEVRGLIPWVDLSLSCEWVPTEKMTEAEKTANASHKTTGGFLCALNRKIQDAFPLVWAKLHVDVKRQFHNLPNFDADKFLACTGVDVRLDADLYPQPAKVEAEPLTVVVGPTRFIELDGIRYKLTPAD